jgi:ABC exporter DevB family membrane fusion protein
MKNKIWMAAAAAILIIFVIVYAMFTHHSAPDPDDTAPLRLAYVAAEGKVETMPGYDVDVGTSELNGRIAKIFVKEGEQVHKGQTVAELENEDLQAQVTQGERELQVAQARLTELESGARKEEIKEADARLKGDMARLDEARNQLLRNRDLRRQNMISQSTLDTAEAAFKAAQAAVNESTQRKLLLKKGPKPETVQLYRDQVQQAAAALDYYRKRLDKTIIRSPIDGTVIERYLDEGEGVTPEIPILAIADLSKIWVNAEVDETDIGRVQIGEKAQVTSNAYPGQTFQGRVREIANYAGARKIRPSNPAVNLGLKVVQVKVLLEKPTPLRLGMTVDVRITPRNDEGG